VINSLNTTDPSVAARELISAGVAGKVVTLVE